MKNKLKDKFISLTDKENGDGGIIVALVVITTLLMVTAFCLGTQHDFNTKTKMDNIVRAYLLVGETQGGLTAPQIVDFQNDLAGILGVPPSDIVVNATLAGSVNYGASIEVGFTCGTYQTYTNKVIKKVTAGAVNKYLSIDSRKVSTSKY